MLKISVGFGFYFFAIHSESLNWCLTQCRGIPAEFLLEIYSPLWIDQVKNSDESASPVGARTAAGYFQSSELKWLPQSHALLFHQWSRLRRQDWKYIVGLLGEEKMSLSPLAPGAENAWLCKMVKCTYPWWKWQLSLFCLSSSLIALRRSAMAHVLENGEGGSTCFCT